MIKLFRRLFKKKVPSIHSTLISSCSSLMMERDEYVLLAPIPGMYGEVSMWGSVNPSFEFQAFDKDRSEFMTVRVEVALPDKMRFYSKTADEGHDAEVHPEHKLLALNLFNHLVRYFPLTPKHKLKKAGDNGAIDKREDSAVIQNQDGQV